MRKNYPARAPPIQSVTTKPEHQNENQLLRKGKSEQGAVCKLQTEKVFLVLCTW